MSDEQDRPQLARSLLLGPALLWGSCAVFLGLGLLRHSPMLGARIWILVVFATRALWIPSMVDLAYRTRWTRIILWPYSRGDAESCARILRSISWLYLIVGVYLLMTAFLIERGHAG